MPTRSINQRRRSFELGGGAVFANRTPPVPPAPYILLHCRVALFVIVYIRRFDLAIFRGDEGSRGRLGGSITAEVRRSETVWLARLFVLLDSPFFFAAPPICESPHQSPVQHDHPHQEESHLMGWPSHWDCIHINALRKRASCMGRGLRERLSSHTRD